MPTAEKVDLKKLEGKLQELHKEMQTLVGEHAGKPVMTVPMDWEAWKAIHFPGYTTPRDLALASSLVDSMIHQVQGLARMQATLVEQAREVSK